MAENKKGFDLASVLGSVPGNVSTLDTGREQIVYLTLDRLRPDPNNFYSLDGIEDLAANIELIGLQQPLRVRPDPDRPEGYILVSGHRRYEALMTLVNEDKEEFFEAACIVEAEAPTESAAMRELKLIYANASTRTLSAADLSRQAERVEALLYQLQEEGVAFPGRMRDHVAQACKTSAAKLARLKVIREKLVEPFFAGRWQDGSLDETSAYALARIPAILQTVIADEVRLHGRKMPYGYVLENFAGNKNLEHFVTGCESCPKGEGCTGARNKLIQTLWVQNGHNCSGGDFECCLACRYLSFCRTPCEHGKAKMADREAKERHEAKQQKKDEKSRQERNVEFVRDLGTTMAKRIAEAAGGREKMDEIYCDACASIGALPISVHHHATALIDLAGDGSIYGNHGTGTSGDLPASLLKAICIQLHVSADWLLGLEEDAK